MYCRHFLLIIGLLVSFPALADGVCTIRSAHNCPGVELDARPAVDPLDARTAMSMAAASHHFRVGQDAPAQVSIGIGSSGGERAASAAVGGPLSDGTFGALQGTYLDSDHKAWSASITFDF